MLAWMLIITTLAGPVPPGISATLPLMISVVSNISDGGACATAASNMMRTASVQAYCVPYPAYVAAPGAPAPAPAPTPVAPPSTTP